jgi:hypothetical protein
MGNATTSKRAKKKFKKMLTTSFESLMLLTSQRGKDLSGKKIKRP